MRFPKSAARLLAMAFAVLIQPARADYVAPTYIGMTPQDVGVMERPRPEYDAKGIPIGGFRLFPTLDLLGTYDDNIFRTPSAQSDDFLTIAPTLRLQSQWGLHFLEVYGGLDNYEYAKKSGEDLTDWKVGADGRLDISRAATVSADAYYGEFHELWSSPNIVGFQAGPNRYDQTHADVISAFQPNRLGFGAGASYDRYNWLNNHAIGGGTLFDTDRDESEYQAYAKIFYDFSPGYSGFVKGSYDDRHFDHFFDRSGLHRSSHGYRIDGGLDVQISHLVAGDIFVGYLKQSFAQDVPTPLPDVSGLDYGVQLDWYASPILTLHLNGQRQLSDVIINRASVSDDKLIKLSGDYEFRPNVIVQANVAYTDSRFVGTARTDHYPGAGISVKYLMNNYMSANVSYNYNERSSNLSGLSYKDNMVSIGLNLHI